LIPSFGFVSDWLAALLLTASFFTTVGNFEAHLPFGWRLIPSLIAFSCRKSRYPFGKT
jgi:hypothetical protein